MAVKGPLTYLVRVPGNNHRFVHADHLVPDDCNSHYPPVEGPNGGEGNIIDKPGANGNREDMSLPELPYNLEDGSIVPLHKPPVNDVPKQPASETAVPLDSDFSRQPNVTPSVPIISHDLPESVSISNPTGQLPSPKCGTPRVGRSSRYGRVIKPPMKLDL